MIKHVLVGAKSAVSSLDEKCYQPNAVDLRIKSISSLDDSPFKLSDDERVHRRRKSVPCVDGWFLLNEGVYDIITEHWVEVSEGECGLVIPRSTLSRNGCLVTGGLYDSGYKGYIGFCLHIKGGKADIKKGTRLAQYLVLTAESYKVYDGSYGVDANGLNKTEENKLYSVG